MASHRHYNTSHFASFSANFLEIASCELHKFEKSGRTMSERTFQQLFGLCSLTVQGYLAEQLHELSPIPMDGSDRLVLDATETPIARPTNSKVQSASFSGYKKRNTLKYEVTVLESSGKPVFFNGPFYGPTGDVTIFDSGLQRVMETLQLPRALADGTYQGRDEHLIVPPRPYKNLSPFQRLYYHALSHRRIVVENFFGRMKSFHCLVDKWRHARHLHVIAFVVVLHCVSADLAARPLRTDIVEAQL